MRLLSKKTICWYKFSAKAGWRFFDSIVIQPKGQADVSDSVSSFPQLLLSFRVCQIFVCFHSQVHFRDSTWFISPVLGPCFVVLTGNMSCRFEAMLRSIFWRYRRMGLESMYLPHGQSASLLNHILKKHQNVVRHCERPLWTQVTYSFKLRPEFWEE